MLSYSMLCNATIAKKHAFDRCNQSGCGPVSWSILSSVPLVVRSKMTSVRAKAIEEMRKKALVRHTDMSQEMSSDAQDVVVMALDKYMEAENWEAASKLIKDTLDKKLGPPWHVMVGKGKSLSRCSFLLRCPTCAATVHRPQLDLF